MSLGDEYPADRKIFPLFPELRDYMNDAAKEVEVKAAANGATLRHYVLDMKDLTGLTWDNLQNALGRNGRGRNSMRAETFYRVSNFLGLDSNYVMELIEDFETPPSGGPAPRRKKESANIARVPDWGVQPTEVAFQVPGRFKLLPPEDLDELEEVTRKWIDDRLDHHAQHGGYIVEDS